MRDTLNLSDLIDIIQLKNSLLPPREVNAAVRQVFTEVTRALTNGSRVEIRGFGVLDVRHYDARVGYNPRDGAPLEIPAKRGVRWKTGKRLAMALNAPTG